MNASSSQAWNALSIDVEDWYHGIEIEDEHQGSFERRLERGLLPVLEALDHAGVRATFFVLGRCVEEHPALIRRIVAAGHEVGTHGYPHTKLYEMTPAAFEANLARSIALISSVTGQPVRGFRAPYFSLTRRSLWAIDILERHGIAYDASIYPGPNWRYGIDGAPEHPHRLAASAVAEFPPSVGHVWGFRFGLGGAYFRILPYPVVAHAMRRINDEGHPAMFYLHPWEFDPGHPYVRFPRKAQLTHYFRLGVTAPRFERLLHEFRFTTAADVLQRMGLLGATALNEGARAGD